MLPQPSLVWKAKVKLAAWAEGGDVGTKEEEWGRKGLVSAAKQSSTDMVREVAVQSQCILLKRLL